MVMAHIGGQYEVSTQTRETAPTQGRQDRAQADSLPTMEGGGVVRELAGAEAAGVPSQEQKRKIRDDRGGGAFGGLGQLVRAGALPVLSYHEGQSLNLHLPPPQIYRHSTNDARAARSVRIGDQRARSCWRPLGVGGVRFGG